MHALIYAALCAVGLYLALGGAPNQGAPRVHGPRLLLWLLLASLLAPLLWSAGLLTLRQIIRPEDPTLFWHSAPSAFLWSTAVAGAVSFLCLPPAALFLVGYARRKGTTEQSGRAMSRQLLTLALPGMLAAALASLTGSFGTPSFASQPSDLTGTVVYTVLTGLTLAGALIGPRLLLRPLGPGALVRRIAA